MGLEACKGSAIAQAISILQTSSVALLILTFTQVQGGSLCFKLP